MGRRLKGETVGRKKREREEGYYGERKGRRLKGGDSGKEGRGKEKKVIKEEMKRRKLKGGVSEKKGKRAKEKRFMKGKEKGHS